MDQRVTLEIWNRDCFSQVKMVEKVLKKALGKQKDDGPVGTNQRRMELAIAVIDLEEADGHNRL